MWRFVAKSGALLHNFDNILQQQCRTTFVLKRRVAPYLHKKGSFPKKMRSRHYVYDLIKDTDQEKLNNIDVILTSYVDSLGNIGDKVSVQPLYAYNNLLLPGLAVYSTPENEEKYLSSQTPSKEVERYSSPNALNMMGTLSRLTLSVTMSKDNPWVLEPWHIKASFRKCSIVVPEDAIIMPPKPIKGPDMSIQNKEFYVTVVINNVEKVKVRCRIHHWSTDILQRLPRHEKFWLQPGEPIFPEDTEVLKGMPNRYSGDDANSSNA